MAATKLYTFTVEGTGAFPIDMLRYDQCWPNSGSHDAQAIANSFHERNVGAPWRITLTTSNNSKTVPTIGRWESFGWKVV